MAKLFLSYAREDAPTASRLARTLEKAGHDVWWDSELHGGASFGSEIEQQLDACDVVLVLWSEAALRSPWVKDEAAVGRDSGKLLPLTLDGTEPPIGFRQFHAVNLAGWLGGKVVVRKLEESIKRLSEAPFSMPPTLPRRMWPVLRARWAGLIALLLLIVGGAAYVWIGRPGDQAISVAIVPASVSSAMSRDYAQSIATDMAAFLPSHAKDASVVEPESARLAAYRFQVSVAAKGNEADANMWLSAGNRPGILWSKSWVDVDLRTSDLEKEMSLAASQALVCVLEANEAPKTLKPQLLAMYVSGCISFGDYPRSAPLLIDLFSKITAEAPDHAPSWSGLALAYAARAESFVDEGKPIPADVRRGASNAIDNAIRLDPKSGKAVLAKVPFVAKRRVDRVALMEEAVRLEPKSALLHRELSGILQWVGRMQDAVAEAERAVELDPLSPETRALYMDTLTRAGRFSTTRDELASAEKIWPHSVAIKSSALVYHLRYGDPHRAEQLIHQLIPEGEAEHPVLIKYLTARRTGNAAAKAETVAGYRALGEREYWGPYVLALATFGEFEEIFRLHDAPGLTDNYIDLFFRPQFAELRHDPRFMRLAARFGLVRYWRTSGHWADFCLDPALPYDCKAEAAKYQ